MTSAAAAGGLLLAFAHSIPVQPVPINSPVGCSENRFAKFSYLLMRNSVQIGGGIRQGCCLSSILFNLYSECLTKEALDGLGDFNNAGQIIQTVKYADDLVLMAKEETVLQGMIDKLIEIGRFMEWK